MSGDILTDDRTWSRRWHDLVTNRLAEIESLAPGRDVAGARYWDSQAPRLAARSDPESAARDPFLRQLLRLAQPTTTILDIGSGIGRFTLGLAPRAGFVTAVDPSRKMLAHLRRQARQQGLAMLGPSWAAGRRSMTSIRSTLIS